jgi:hypothetical protein
VPLFEESRLSRAFYGSGDDGGGSWSSSLQQSPVEELVHPALRPAFSQHLVESPLHAAPAAAVLCPSDERSVSSMSSLSSQFPTLPLLGVGVGNAAGASWQFGLFNGPDAAMHTAEKAIFRIVEMGFTVDQAKGALKITDMGDGLKVDRAVEFLLQQQGGWD